MIILAKKCIQIFLLFMIFMQIFAPSANAAQTPSIQSFREWKADKIKAVIQQTMVMRNTVLKTKTFGPAKSLPALEKQLSQLNFNLEVAQDLSVTDYFVLYLSQQPQTDRFKLAAAKLTTAEVADLMQAYAQSLAVSPNSSLENTSPSDLASQALVAPEHAR